MNELEHWQKLFQDERAAHAETRAKLDKAQSDFQFMVERACNESLDGYRELGQRAADAERQHAETRAELDRLRDLAAGQGLLDRTCTPAERKVLEAVAALPIVASDAQHYVGRPLGALLIAELARRGEKP